MTIYEQKHFQHLSPVLPPKIHTEDPKFLLDTSLSTIPETDDADSDDTYEDVDTPEDLASPNWRTSRPVPVPAEGEGADTGTDYENQSEQDTESASDAETVYETYDTDQQPTGVSVEMPGRTSVTSLRKLAMGECWNC